MSDMKCPFCGKKLWYDEQDGIYRCMKKFACVMHYEGGTEQLWQELIRTRKALEIAIDEITKIRVAAESVGIGFFMTAAISALVKIKTALEQKDVK